MAGAHKSIYRFLGAGLVVAVCSGCSHPDSEALRWVDGPDLVAAREITEFPDGQFVGKIGDLEYTDGRWYLCDTTDRQVLVRDADLAVLRVIGRRGKGPGELAWCSGLAVVDDSVFVYDAGARAVSVFDTSGVYVRRAPTGEIRFGFAPVGVRIYGSARFGETPIEAFGPDGQSVDGFGKVVRPDADPTITSAKNMRLVRRFDDASLVAVGNGIPIVEHYDAWGALLRSFDLSNMPAFSDRMRRVDEETGPLDGGGFRSIGTINDIALAGSTLLMIAYVDDDDANLVDVSISRPSAVRRRRLLDPAGIPLVFPLHLGVASDGGRVIVYDAMKGVLVVYDGVGS